MFTRTLPGQALGWVIKTNVARSRNTENMLKVGHREVMMVKDCGAGLGGYVFV